MKALRSVLAVVLMVLAGGAWAQLTAGRDYTELRPAQPVESGKKVEVAEFFWYGCIHCYHFEPQIKAWVKRKPADVEFRYVPGTFANPAWEPLTRTFYALDSLGLAGKHHDALFVAIHEEKDAKKQKLLVTDRNTITDWLATQGVDKKKFIDAYNSFSVSTRYQRSVDITRAYSIEGTPTLAIDGKYLIAPSMEGYYGGRNANGSPKIDYDRFFRNLDLLIAQARKARAGK
jgi:thiol:disulfide interchange protein DsbA